MGFRLPLLRGLLVLVLAVPLDAAACQDAVAGIETVSFARFVGTLAVQRDIHRLVESLEARFQAKNFVVPLPFTGGKKLWIFQERDFVREALAAKSKLPYVNKNFDASHGHYRSINSVDTGSELWHSLHSHLTQIFKSKRIEPLMEKHRHLLTASHRYNLNDALETFFLRVWGEYCFGPQDPAQFKAVRDELVEVLARVFHRNALNRLPYLGRLTSERNYRRNRRELRKVDQKLGVVLRQAIANRDGAFFELYERLRPTYGEDAFQITLDNSFLAVLVYDFLYIVLLDAMANVAKTPAVDRAEQVKRSTHTGFLYPFRFREAEEPYLGVRAGDYVMVNLQKSGLYFSYGARFCPGMNLFKATAAKLLEIYAPYDIRLVNPGEAIRYNGSRDVPIMTSRHEVVLTPKAQ